MFGIKYLTAITDILLVGILSGTAILVGFSCLFYNNNILYDVWQVSADYSYSDADQVRLVVNDYFLSFDQSDLNIFTPQEQAHLVEVTFLAMAAGNLGKMGVAFMMMVVGWFIFFRKSGYRLYRLFGLSAIVSLLFFSSFILASLINFNSFFVAFHNLLFKNDWWLLTSDSLLIQTYPESFFNFMFIIWLIFLLIFSIIFLIISLKIKKYMDQREPGSCPGCGGECDCGK